MILSILIPTLPDRVDLLSNLTNELDRQIKSLGKESDIEILLDFRDRETPTGTKRNALLRRSVGKYVWFIDDDDTIAPNAIELLLNAFKKDPDVIGINGEMSTDGTNIVDWEIRLNNPYQAITRDNKTIYVRWPNHITPMRSSIAKQIDFPDITLGEDYRWSVLLKDSGLLKTEIIITEKIYFYKFISNK